MTIVAPSSTSQCATICGIDPGSLHLGFCVFRFNMDTFEILSIESTTISPDKLVREDDPIADTHNGRIQRIAALKSKLTDLYSYYDPTVICCESSYYNRFRPSAFGVLMECITAIRFSALAYNPYVPMRTHEPSIIKKTVGAHATKGGKDAMRIALKDIPDIMKNVDYQSIDHLDDHAIDAIAVAYTEYTCIKKAHTFKSISMEVHRA